MQIAEIENELLTYADFEEVASVSRARLFITAAKRWLILRPTSASNQSSSLSMDTTKVENMLKRAQDYVAANARTAGGGAGGVKFLGVGSSFR